LIFNLTTNQMFFFQTQAPIRREPSFIYHMIERVITFSIMSVIIGMIIFSVFIISQTISIIYGGYQMSTSLLNSIILDPIYQMNQVFQHWLAPYLFHAKCYLGGDFSWDQCLEASHYYPFEFLSNCRNYQLLPQQCWDLMQLFPQDYLHNCINLNGKDYCLKLFQIFTS